MKSLKSLIGETKPDKDESCAKHGPFVSKNPLANIWTGCPACDKARAEERRLEEEEKERQHKALRWAASIQDSGIPERFRDRELSVFEAATQAQQKALNTAVEYANQFGAALDTGRSMVFIGKPGTGKTHLAIGIGLHVMRRGATVYFSTVMRVIRKIKDTWSKDSDLTETQAIKLFTFPDLLILDEVGIQFGSEFEKNILFDIMNERYENRKPTIMLSNLGIDEIKLYLGERVFDRMREDGGKFVVFDWESWRSKK